MTLCSLSPITERLTVSTRKRQIIGSVVAWYGQSDSVHYAISYAFLYVCSKKAPTFCSVVVRPMIGSKECSRDIPREMMPANSPAAAASDAASVSIRETGYRAMTVSYAIA